MPVHAAEGVRLAAGCVIMLRPGVRRRRMIGVDVDRVSTHVLVVGIPAVFVVAVSIAMVVVVGIVVAIATVIANVVIPAVPGRISVVRAAVIRYRGGAVPTAVPTAVSP